MKTRRNKRGEEENAKIPQLGKKRRASQKGMLSKFCRRQFWCNVRALPEPSAYGCYVFI